MRCRLFVALAVAAVWSACTCGARHVGAPCTTNSSCGPGLVCSTGHCAEPSDGGSTGPDGGNGTSGGGLDAGWLPDGGYIGDGGCVNLQCQQSACPNGGTTRLSGTVYDPGASVPLYNAVVYVPNGAVAPFTPGITCDQCGAITTGSPLVVTLSAADGTFTLNDVPSGTNIPLVIQIGKWRRQVTIPQVNPCVDNPVTDVNLTRLPRNKSEGDIPLIAIASGSADPMQCLLRKIGIDDSEFTPPNGNGRVHYYVSNGISMSGAPGADSLWNDAGSLPNYDIVLLPCEGAQNLKPATATQNIVNYANSGGRVFTTHYGYVWTQYGASPFPLTADWEGDNGVHHPPPDPWTVYINQSFPKGAAFAQWLQNVGASTTLGVLTVHEGRNDVWSVDAGTTAWMDGGFTVSATTHSEVPHLTFNTPFNPPNLPDGGPGLQCGRVVFSDFHVSTTGAADAGGTFPSACYGGALTAQEKALEFMLFDLSSCIQKDDVAPTVCQGAGQACGSSAACCQGLACIDGAGQTCDGGTGCSCTVLIQ